MRTILSLIFLSQAFSLAAQKAKTTNEATNDYFTRQRALVGREFPSFVVRHADSVFTEKTFRNQTVFINFWFESCAPCMAEMEGLNALYEKTRSLPNFLFFSFTFETPEKVKALREKFHIAYPVLSVSPEECRRLNQGMGFPTNLVVAPNGKIAYLISGGSTSKEEAKKFLLETVYAQIHQSAKRP